MKAERTGSLGIYIHWPFCASKCPYCDFNTYVSKVIDHDSWRAAYIKSIHNYAEQMPDREVRSIFFGGGTPSLMPAQTVEEIIYTIQKNWRVSNHVEITLEANPTSVEIDKFRDFQAAGVNRVSLGVQAFNDKDLKFLGRGHSADEAQHAIETARTVFDRYSFDLIYARPEQDLKSWEAELFQAREFFDSHISLYQLTIERNTPFYKLHARGDFSIPDEVLGADFYHLTQDVMEAFGLPAYEVSNHAKAGEESRHNMTYWTYDDYVGIGPGAHGRLTIDGQKYATQEDRVPNRWLEKVQAVGSGADPYEALDSKGRLTEALMMGLRLRGGISLADLAQSCSSKETLKQGLDQEKIAITKREGWMEDHEGRLTLTREGWLRLNAIVPYILRV